MKKKPQTGAEAVKAFVSHFNPEEREVIPGSSSADMLRKVKANKDIASNKAEADTSSKPSAEDQLMKMVEKYNDFAGQNDLPVDLIDTSKYFDKNSPQFLDGEDSVNEEKKYLQNQHYKNTGDKRYVPTYEDVKEMDDDQFVLHMNKLMKEGEPTGTTSHEDNITRKPVPELDKMSDEKFTDLLNKQYL